MGVTFFRARCDRGGNIRPRAAEKAFFGIHHLMLHRGCLLGQRFSAGQPSDEEGAETRNRHKKATSRMKAYHMRTMEKISKRDKHICCENIYPCIFVHAILCVFGCV
jgi:hypothetical protein